jgi:hypothetical protein
VLLWVPPPPSDRLWFAFVEPPNVTIKASPLIANRILKHSIILNKWAPPGQHPLLPR